MYDISSLEFNIPDNDVFQAQDPAIPDYFKSKYYYNYLGIPLKLNYYVIQKKVGVYLIGGIKSDFFLNAKYRAYLEFEGREEIHTQKQKDVDFNKVNLIGLAGFGIDYKIAQRLKLRFEPIFRYSFTPIVDSDLKEYLYSVGVNFSILLN